MASEISIIVPVFNEEGNIVPLSAEVAQVFANTHWTYELVFVDDASTDRSWSQIVEVCRRSPLMRGFRHGRNAGQSAALWTGIRSTGTPIIATMDGDRQNDPADFPKMLSELGSYDFICGVRVRRQDSAYRRLSAKVARAARKAVLKVDFADTGCGLRVFRRSALDGVPAFNGMHRFLPVLVHAGGARTLEVPVNHRPRVAGYSKYGTWNRLGRGIVDLLAIAWFQRRRFKSQITEATTSTLETVTVLSNRTTEERQRTSV